MEGSETATRLGLGGSDPAAAGKGLPNLMLPAPDARTAAAASGGGGASGEDQGLSLLTFLRNMHPTEWDNFRERVARLARGNRRQVSAPRGGEKGGAA